MADVRYQIAVDAEPDAALSEDIAEMEVSQTIEGPTTFRLGFAVDICGEDMEPLDDERLKPGDPDTLITVMAFVDGRTYVLAHGIITERQAKLEKGGAGSFLDIQGTDRRAIMEREERRTSHTGLASDVVSGIFASYGFLPDVQATEIEYSEGTNALSQTENDFAFVEQLAGRNGMRVWIDWAAEVGFAGFEVMETAHFKPSPPRPAANPLGFVPPLLLADPGSPVLRINTADSCDSITSFEVKANAEAPNQSGPIARVDPTGGTVDGTDVPGPSDEPLGDDAPAPGQARTRTLVTPGGVDEARVRNQAALNDAAWTVSATCETTVHALGEVLMPHQVVRVEGTGRLNDGDYFVKSVTHTISAADHKMRVELMRNALGAA